MFAAEMLRDVQACSVLSKLELLFDCAGRAAAAVAAAAAAAVPLGPPRDEASTAVAAAARLALFDVVGALRTAAINARGAGAVPQSGTLPSQLLSIARQLHKADRKKLVFRFHPDRLVYMLGYAPSEIEKAMATKATHFLNVLLGDDAQHSSVAMAMSTLEELNALRIPPPQAAAAGVGGGAEDVADLLERLRLAGAHSGRRRGA